MTNPLINPPYDSKHPVQTAFNLLLDIKGKNDLEIAINYYILKFLLSQPGTLDGVKTVHFARFQFWQPTELAIPDAIQLLWKAVAPALKQILHGMGMDSSAEAILGEIKKGIDAAAEANNGSIPFQKQVSLITAFDGNFAKYIVDFSDIIYERFNLLLPFANIPDDVVPVQKNIGNFLKLMEENQNEPVSFSSNYGALTLVQVLQNAKRSNVMRQQANAH